MAGRRPTGTERKSCQKIVSTYITVWSTLLLGAPASTVLVGVTSPSNCRIMTNLSRTGEQED